MLQVLRHICYDMIASHVGLTCRGNTTVVLTPSHVGYQCLQPVSTVSAKMCLFLCPWQQVGCYLLSSIVFSVSTVLQKAPFTRRGLAVTGNYGVCSGPFLFLAQCLWTESWNIRYPTIYRCLRFFFAMPSGAGVSPSTAGTAMWMVKQT